MDVYREILPDSYLLILANTPSTSGDEVLRRALQQAGSSGKSSVWVDCNHLPELPADALRLMGSYYRLLQEKYVNLVLCHLADELQVVLQDLPGPQRPPVVGTLLEAACYCRSHRLRQPNQPRRLR